MKRITLIISLALLSFTGFAKGPTAPAADTLAVLYLLDGSSAASDCISTSFFGLHFGDSREAADSTFAGRLQAPWGDGDCSLRDVFHEGVTWTAADLHFAEEAGFDAVTFALRGDEPLKLQKTVEGLKVSLAWNYGRSQQLPDESRLFLDGRGRYILLRSSAYLIQLEYGLESFLQRGCKKQ